MKITKIFLILALISGLSQAQMYMLDQCIELALQNKESLQNAVLDVETARYGKTGSLSNILPSFGAGAGYSMSKFKERTNYATNTKYSTSTGNSWGLQLSQTIYDGGAWWNKIASAGNNYRIMQEMERQVKTNVIYAVVESFYSVLKLQQLLDVARMNLMLANQQVELVTNQFEIGAAAKTDLLKVNVLKGQAQVDVITRDAQLQDAVRNLKNAMGMMDQDGAIMVNDDLGGEYAIPEIDSALASMEHNNPSILAKQAQIKGAELNHKIINGARLPSLDASMRYNYQSADATGLVAEDDWSTSLSLSFQIPLFTGFDLHTKTQQAKITIRQEVNEYNTQLHDLRVRLEGLLEILNNYRETIPINEEVLESAEEDLKLVQEQYSLGSVTILEVLDAQLSVTRARSSLVSARYDAQIQAAALEALLGTLDQNY